MAKRPKPRWNEKRSAIESPSALSAETIKNFAALLNLSDENHIANMEEHLNQTALFYKQNVDIERGEKPGEVLAALDKLQMLAGKLSERIGDIPSKTEDMIRRNYSPSRFDHEKEFTITSDGFKRDILHLRRLLNSIAPARHNAPRDKGGKSSQSALDILVRMLGEIYQELTGEPFRGPLSIKAGKELPGKFVRSAVGVIDPEAKSSAIDTAMRRAVRYLISANKSS